MTYRHMELVDRHCKILIYTQWIEVLITFYRSWIESKIIIKTHNEHFDERRKHKLKSLCRKNINSQYCECENTTKCE